MYNNSKFDINLFLNIPTVDAVILKNSLSLNMHKGWKSSGKHPVMFCQKFLLQACFTLTENLPQTALGSLLSGNLLF